MPATPPAPARPCPDTPTCVTDVVVVGGGALGAATAWWLARSGRSVVLLEEGTARLLRLAARGTTWSAHPSWTGDDDRALLADAVEAWGLLERQTGADLLTRRDAVDHCGSGSARCRPGEALQVRADHAVAALLAGATGHGAVLRYRSPVVAVEALDDRVEVRTAAGRIRARRAIVTSVRAVTGPAVELHFRSRVPVGPATPLIAHHDPDLGPMRAVPCARGHIAVGAGSGPRGTLGDLREHVRAWLPDLDVDRPEPVGPEAMSTGTCTVTVDRTGPLLTAVSTALGSVTTIARGRELAEQALVGERPAGRRARA